MTRILTKTIPLFLAGLAWCAFPPAPAEAGDVLKRFDFDLTGGSRVDQFDWNIAGNSAGKSPDIASELTWKDLKSTQVSARGKIIMTNERFPFGGEVKIGGSYGAISSGDNQDSQYTGDGRTQEVSRTVNRADDGELWDGSVGGGIVFFNRDRTFSLVPMVGMSYHQQNLTIQDGYESVPPPGGSFSGPDSTYETAWRGGFLGLDFDFIPSEFFDLHGSVEYHAGKYEAEANWNLPSDPGLEHPRSFRQTSDHADGMVNTIGMRLGARNLFFTLDYSYQKWQARDGEHTAYYPDASITVTKLNEVNWQASSITGGLTLRF